MAARRTSSMVADDMIGEIVGGAGVLLSSALAFAGDPVGRYSVAGSNPGNGANTPEP